MNTPWPESLEHMRLSALAGTLVSALLLAGQPLAAQPVLGLGDDALTLPRGVVRVRVLTSLVNFSERFGKNTPGRADGSAEPLGVDITLDTVGLRQFPSLAPVQAGLRSLTGITNFNLSLGKTVVVSQARVQTTPLVLEMGLTNRISIGAIVPIVSARNEITLSVNPTGREGNVSFNPVRSGDATAAQNNATLVAQLDGARTQLTTLIATCTANPSASALCPAVIASGPGLATGTGAFSQGITQLYGTSASTGAPFVPYAGTGADSAIRLRLTTLRSAYQQFGITAIAATTVGPARGVAITPDGAQRILTDSAFGILAAPLRTFTRQGLGDVEIAMKFRAFDSFGVGNDTARFNPRGVNFRQSFTGLFRLGTGTIESPDNFVDLSTGNGQNDVEVRSLSDLIIGRRFFTTFAARYVVQLADQQVLRINDQPDLELAALYRRRLVERDLGDQIEFEITPRFMFNDFFSVGAQYFFRSKAEDKYSGTFAVPQSESGLPSAITLDASTLNQESSATEQRFGLGVSFSTTAAFARGKAKFPVEVQYFNSRSILGSGGEVPKLSIHQLQVRVYGRLFGGR